MMTIRLLELEKHRNETTFRPYLIAAHIFRDYGIEFVLDDVDKYDITWVANASVLDKKLSIADSVNYGYNTCKKIAGPYYILDGQDAHTLIGINELLVKLLEDGIPPVAVLKNSLLSKEDYLRGNNFGRYYWGTGDYTPDISKTWQYYMLSGTNWLSTLDPTMSRLPESQTIKNRDISAMFSMNRDNVPEHGKPHYEAYNSFRQLCMNSVDVIESKKYKVNRLIPGTRVDEQEYFRMMLECRAILAPFGYGEIAPRDIHSALLNCVLIKPSMSHLKTTPNIYLENVTYIPCAHDYSDLPEVVEKLFDDSQSFEYYWSNLHEMFLEEYALERRVQYIASLIKSTI